MRTFHVVPRLAAVLLACGLLPTGSVMPAIDAQTKAAEPADRAKLIAAARELMTAQPYCALVTIDESGRPSVRTMNPFPPEEDMTVYMATNTRSRKVQEIGRDARVCLYYADHGKATGYVALTGTAVLVTDASEIQKRRRAYWDTTFEPGLKNLVLIKVVPERLEVIDYKRGLTGDTVTWRSPSRNLQKAGSK